MATIEQGLEFINLLREAARAKKIKWERTPDRDTFRAKLPNGSHARIELATVRDDTGVPQQEYTLNLLDENGYSIQEWGNGGGPSIKEQLKNLHEQARSSALRVEETLQDALKGLRRVVQPEKGTA